MSDQRLRELERSWRVGGAEEAEAALLRERLRLGVIGEPRLRLAAAIGHAASGLLLGPRAPAGDLRRRLAAIDGELGRAGPETVVRAAIALARSRVRLWGHTRASGSRSDRASLLAALEAAEAWVRCPCDAHLADAAETVAPAERAVQGLRARTARSAYYALRAARVVVEPNYRVLGLEYEPAQDAEALRQALRAELVPWLVGHADPVAARG